MAAGKCHSLETCESHKFSNKHMCAHVCWLKGSARPQPEPPTGAGRGQAKNWRRPGWALPGRAGGCDTARPGIRVPGHCTSAASHAQGPECPTAPVHSPAVAQTPCALDPCVQALVCPGSHRPRIPCPRGLCALCSLHPLSPGSHTLRTPCTWTPYLWDPKPLHSWDFISLGPHTPGDPDPYTVGTPHPHTSGAPYPWNLSLPGTPIPTPPGPLSPYPATPMPPAPAPRHSRPAPAGLRALSQVSWNFASCDARAGAGPRPPCAANGRPGCRGGGQSALAGQFPGPDRPSPPGRGGHKRAPRRRAALPLPAPPLQRTRYGRHCGTGGEVSAGSGGREAVPMHWVPVHCGEAALLYRVSVHGNKGV